MDNPIHPKHGSSGQTRHLDLPWPEHSQEHALVGLVALPILLGLLFHKPHKKHMSGSHPSHGDGITLFTLRANRPFLPGESEDSRTTPLNQPQDTGCWDVRRILLGASTTNPAITPMNHQHGASRPKPPRYSDIHGQCTVKTSFTER